MAEGGLRRKKCNPLPVKILSLIELAGGEEFFGIMVNEKCFT